MIVSDCTLWMIHQLDSMHVVNTTYSRKMFMAPGYLDRTVRNLCLEYHIDTLTVAGFHSRHHEDREDL